MKNLVRFLCVFLLLFGLAPNVASPGGMTFKTTGNPQLDATINSEAGNISRVFGVTPVLYTLDDSDSANAFANCSTNSVSIGLRLLRDQLWNMNYGGLAVAGIMAHEFTHIYQCKSGDGQSGMNKELQADYMAGWYLRHEKADYGFDISGFARSVWSMGDFNFRDPSHHGTPDQRVAAMTAGFKNVTTSVATAFANSNAYFDGGDDSSTPAPAPRVCERQVPCQHVVPCEHRVPCQHIVPIDRQVPCQHIVMTPYGPMPMHQFDVITVMVPAHEFDVMHPGGDRLHPYDVQKYNCND